MRVRPPRRDEAAAVLALTVARDIADIGRPDITLEDVLGDWDAYVGQRDAEPVPRPAKDSKWQPDSDDQPGRRRPGITSIGGTTKAVAFGRN